MRSLWISTSHQILFLILLLIYLVIFLVGTLSLCGIPPFSCFWSKDEILNDSRLYSPIFAIIACSAARLIAFYMFWIYLLVFEGYLNVHFLNFNEKKIVHSIQYLYGGTNK